MFHLRDKILKFLEKKKAELEEKQEERILKYVENKFKRVDMPQLKGSENKKIFIKK